MTAFSVRAVIGAALICEIRIAPDRVCARTAPPIRIASMLPE
jgi:hypothetical protein